MFPPGADPELLSSVSGRMCDAPPEIALKLLRAAVSYQLGNALRAAGVPIRAINSTGFPTNVAGNRRFGADFSVLIMDGVESTVGTPGPKC